MAIGIMTEVMCINSNIANHDNDNGNKNNKGIEDNSLLNHNVDNNSNYIN